jgi:hypothetical protein
MGYLAERAPTEIVATEQVANCPFSLSLEVAPAFFLALENGGGVRLPLDALGASLSGTVSRSVSVTAVRRSDRTELGRPHDEFAFDWNARSRWFPKFNGVLRLRPAASATRIVLDGQYIAPFGWFGGIFDRYVGRRIASATARDLVARLALMLEETWAQERRARPPDLAVKA